MPTQSTLYYCIFTNLTKLTRSYLNLLRDVSKVAITKTMIKIFCATESKFKIMLQVRIELTTFRLKD